nr:dGTPase [Zophobihabitans entericus]
MIDFNKKMNYHRHVEKRRENLSDEYDIVRCFESDRGRIINSAAIRRLQQKTQVFPLERNAVVRTRLTHSMEVQQVGRYIVKEILYRLSKDNQLESLGLSQWTVPMESMVEMACLMHDIGNPPFGHFGESAINKWFKHKLALNKPSYYHLLNDEAGKDKLNELRHKIRQDLCHFEGNAQAIRLVHTLLKLNLTYSQIACILKYTRPAYWTEDIPTDYQYLMKKPGFYLSEEAFIQELREKLDMKPFYRYPLTYIMEAADDISYCIADLEDAVEKKIFTVDRLYQLLGNAWGKVTKGDLFDQTVNVAYQRLKDADYLPTGIDQFFMFLRVNTIAKLVPHATERFIENLPAIFDGSFNSALLEDKGAEYQLLEIFKTVGFNHVFNHESIETIEMQGYRIISGLLDIYSPLLEMNTQDFAGLAANKRSVVKNYMIESRLFHKLSAKHCVAYNEAISRLDPNADDYAIWEFYYRCRLIQDYISGMTDHFAYDEYRKFIVAD